jgi:hypothetical protein
MTFRYFKCFTNYRPFCVLAISLQLLMPGIAFAQNGRSDVADESARVLRQVGSAAQSLSIEVKEFGEPLYKSLENIGVVIEALKGVEQGSVEEKYLIGRALDDYGRIYDALLENAPGFLEALESVSETANSAVYRMRRLEELRDPTALVELNFENQRVKCSDQARNAIEKMNEYTTREENVPDYLNDEYEDNVACMEEMYLEIAYLRDERKITEEEFLTLGMYDANLAQIARRLTPQLGSMLKSYAIDLRKLHNQIRRVSGSSGTTAFAKMRSAFLQLQQNLEPFRKTIPIMVELSSGWAEVITPLGQRLSAGGSDASVPRIDKKVVRNKLKRLNDLNKRHQELLNRKIN